MKTLYKTNVGVVSVDSVCRPCIVRVFSNQKRRVFSMYRKRKGAVLIMELEFRKGRVLYRTPSSETDEGIYGHFYSIKSVAGMYVEHFKGSSSKIYKFKTKKTLKLVDFSDIKTFEYLDKHFKNTPIYETFQAFTGYGLRSLRIWDKETDEELCVYKNKKALEPMICDQVLDYVEGEYGHKTFGKELCKLGYDGYHMPNNWQSAAYEPDYDLYFHKEYFICKPKDSLEKIAEV